MSLLRTADVSRPRVEGTVAVRDGRRLGFAAFGSPNGTPIVWMHGTPGARRQIPLEIRILAEQRDLRILGIDRPGIGSSTAHPYRDLLDWTEDLEIFADTLGIDTFRIIGLSGGGPYALAAGAALGSRVERVAVLGGVAPTVGPDAVGGGVVGTLKPLAPAIEVARVPLGWAVYGALRLTRPLGGAGLELYRAGQPEGDKRLLGRPEFKAMFVDDLLNGSRRQVSAPILDLLLFCRDWGFRLADVQVPVIWWHGDGDHIVPFRHGEECVAMLPDAVLLTMEGESHLGGLGLAEELLNGVLHGLPKRGPARLG
jgi:pimeloyl-ACP methyl ester carboxylesterase